MSTCFVSAVNAMIAFTLRHFDRFSAVLYAKFRNGSDQIQLQQFANTICDPTGIYRRIKTTDVDLERLYFMAVGSSVHAQPRNA